MVDKVPLVANPQLLQAEVAPPPAYIIYNPCLKYTSKSPVGEDAGSSLHPPKYDVIQGGHVPHVVGTYL